MGADYMDMQEFYVHTFTFTLICPLGRTRHHLRSRGDTAWRAQSLQCLYTSQVKSSLYINNRQPYGSLSNELRIPEASSGGRESMEMAEGGP